MISRPLSIVRPRTYMLIHGQVPEDGSVFPESKTALVRAVRWTGDNLTSLMEFLHIELGDLRLWDGRFGIKRGEDTVWASPDDVVYQTIDGSYHVSSSGEFEFCYKELWGDDL